MNRYRKMMVAAAGVIAIVLADVFNVTLPYGPEVMVDAIISTLTAFGVWAVPNAE